VAAAKGDIKEQNELWGWHRYLARKARNAIPHFAEFWRSLSQRCETYRWTDWHRHSSAFARERKEV